MNINHHFRTIVLDNHPFFTETMYCFAAIEPSMGTFTYDIEAPVKSKIKRIGTLSELGRVQLNPNDQRIFYELETIGEIRNFVFTITTINWITKI